ncbi:GNAT family N-acetyltransferase [Mycolicibacterium phlei]|jgi:ribosomal protein S18 acetylase RimI-like enzyme
MAEAILRRATDSDVTALQDLAARAFDKYTPRIGKPPAPALYDYAEVIRTHDVWVITEDSRVVAMLATQRRPDHVFLDVIAVAPEAQGGGHGRRLMRRAEDDAREHGLGEVRLYTNEAMTENQEFYPRLGYREVDRRFDEGYQRIFYVKTVTA